MGRLTKKIREQRECDVMGKDKEKSSLSISVTVDTEWVMMSYITKTIGDDVVNDVIGFRAPRAERQRG